jgi:helix-turn-helix protein
MDQPRLKKPPRQKPVTRDLPRMLSIADLAEMFGRAPRTIRSWIARGIFAPIKVGNAVFIPQTQVDALLSKPNRSRPHQKIHRNSADKPALYSVFQERLTVIQVPQ